MAHLQSRTRKPYGLARDRAEASVAYWKLIEIWYQQHYMRIPFPLSADGLMTSLLAANEFFRLADADKQLFKVSPEITRGEIDLGYIDRRNVPGKDAKQFFHWNDRCGELFYEAMTEQPGLERLKLPLAKSAMAVSERFISSVRELHHYVRLSALKFIATMGVKHPRFTNDFVDAARHINIVIRVVCYETLDALGAYSAMPHCDNGPFTIHIGDNAPGLYFGSDPKSSEAVKYAPGTALLFPSATFLDHLPKKLSPIRRQAFKPAEHGVKGVLDSFGREGFGGKIWTNRLAIIGFVNPLKKRVASKKEIFPSAH